jgi:exopolysaccharide/PEP-CTERM locus tyrosine autokinase
MSLIERAVERLARNEPQVPSDRPGTIEALADRLAHEPAVREAKVREPAGPAIARPPQGVESAPAAPVTLPEPVRIHLEGLRAAGFVTPSGEHTPAFAQFRVIKRPLLNNAFGRQDRPALPNARRVMVTSAFPGEGKSYCSTNLAMSIAAERDHKVILIDADVARPSLPRILGIPSGPGLLDWLVTDTPPDLAEIVLPTNVDGLSIVRAGQRHEHATELLASAAMGRLLDALTTRYPDAILIVDTPPLLVTTEARVVASHMGQIVMVVEAGKTSRESVAEALSTIESCEVVGLVLNKAQKIESQGYYQGYGYGQGAV